MNIRKNIDYSEMYEELDLLMEKELSQMELYCRIGKAVCRRTEKGAAVMASEYLNKQYPDVKGFSPRSLRRMRDFYRTYENHSALLSLSMELGWTLNVVIMEADLTMDLREWYLRASKQFGWSKIELLAHIAAKAYLEIALDVDEEEYDNGITEENTASDPVGNAVAYSIRKIVPHFILRRCRGRPKREGVPWHTMCMLLLMEKNQNYNLRLNM